MLNEFKILDALIREKKVRKRRGLDDPRVPYTVLVNRVIKENDKVNEFSARPQTSKYLKSLKKEGYISKEKIGRNVLYDVTAKGRFYNLSNRDVLDHRREWLEDPDKGVHYSYAIVPSKLGLIHERRGHNSGIKDKELLTEAVKHIKEKNPAIDSIYIRIGDEEQE